MSFEVLLLLAVVVLLPLIQLLVRSARQRDQRLSKHGEGRLPVTQPAKQGPATGAPAVSPLRAPAGESAQDALTARARTSRRDAARSGAPSPTGREGARRQMAAFASLDDGAGLRRAIVLTAILGPCRAHDPHARSESGLP